MTTAMLKHQSPALDLSIFQQRVKYSTGAPKAVLPPKYASAVRKIFKWFLPQYQGQSIGKTVYKACSTYPDFKEFWVDECQLPETFQTWFSTTSLYVWMAMVRIRADPGAKHYNQGLVDHFFRDTEERIRASGIKSSRIVNDTLKDLVSSFKGTVMSLDEGFARSDAVLAAAIWRNLVPVDEAVLPIDAVTKYVRRQLQRLNKCDIAELSSGNFVFEPIDFKALNKTD
ncbi:Ubiquinol cytochrome-c reductase assembly protein Cbp3 [Coemansia sp. RSA 2603]|nr:Ubiquinol cytochrome-c reductase assembly protein Cbp3 [Coemansia sp. RSA 2603]